MASTNTLFPISLPLRGLNTIDPFNAEEGYARELTNWAIKDGRIYMRPGVESSVYNGTYAKSVLWFIPSTGVAYLDNGEVRNLNTSALVATKAVSNTIGTSCKHKDKDFVYGVDVPFLNDGTWANWGFTTVTITASSIRSMCSHRGRLYCSDQSGNLNYSNPGATSGTMAGNFDLSQFLSQSEYVAALFSVSINPSVTVDNVLAIFGNKGTVLVYSGSDPAAATWSLAAKFQMPAPLAYNSFSVVDGDVMVGTNLYCYWFRDLFTGGAQTAYANSPSKPIENLYQYCAAQTAFGATRAAFGYLPGMDVILARIYAPTLISALAGSNTSSYVTLAYFRKYDAWAIWTTTPFEPPYIIDDTTQYLYGVGNTTTAQILYMRLAGNNYDTYQSATKQAIESTWKTPYYPPLKGKGHSINGARVFYENTADTSFSKVRSIFDYSDYNNLYGFYTQSTITAVNPGKYFESSFSQATANSYNQYSPLIGVGGRGGTFSLQLTQNGDTTSSSKYRDIYAVVAYLQEGGEYF